MQTWYLLYLITYLKFMWASKSNGGLDKGYMWCKVKWFVANGLKCVKSYGKFKKKNQKKRSKKKHSSSKMDKWSHIRMVKQVKQAYVFADKGILTHSF